MYNSPLLGILMSHRIPNILNYFCRHVSFINLGESNINLFYKTHIQARRQWLTPVILATQEAEIRRIQV
jgi:hypothetical protein